MGLLGIFTPAAFVLCLGNSCILFFISFQCHTTTAVTHMHSVELIHPPALNSRTTPWYFRTALPLGFWHQLCSLSPSV